MAKHRKNQHRRAVRKRWKTSRILTWLGLGCLATAIVVLGFFAFLDADNGPRRSVRQAPVVSDESRVRVDVVDNDFEPGHLTIQPGTEVIWTFKGRAAHDVTDGLGAFESGTMGRGDEFALTFEEPGTYYYSCTLHHAMQGTLVVQP